ncbi:MAG: co-chaperone GroES [bacterium]
MKIKPLADRVLVKPAEEKEKTKGGIFIPDTVTKERPQEGEVIAVGKGKVNDSGEAIALSVKVGDMVLFRKYGGTEIEIADEKFLIMGESDILAIIE